MKITDVIIHPLQADHGHLTWTAHEPFARAILTLVEVRTDEGIVGIGEVASGPQSVVCDMLKMITPAILGMDPRGHVDIWDRMLSITTPRRGAIFDGDGLPPPLARHLRWPFMAAMAGIDIALWDIKAKSANLPVFRLMGGTRTDVFTYAVGGMYRRDGKPSDYADELAEFVKVGFKAVKLKSGALSLDKEVERIRAVRDAIGPDVQLALDVNAAYDVEECIEYANTVAEFDIAWLEEPLHWYLQPSDYVRLARASPDPARARRTRMAPLRGARLHRLRRVALHPVRFRALRRHHRRTARGHLRRAEERDGAAAFVAASARAPRVGARQGRLRGGVRSQSRHRIIRSTIAFSTAARTTATGACDLTEGARLRRSKWTGSR